MSRSRLLAAPAGPAALGVFSGLLMVVAVFLPWYAANLGAPTEPGTASGWDATAIGKAALALGIMWGLASVLLAADQLDSYRIDPRTAEALGWFVTGCALVAGLLVAYRLLRPPEPADFLSRDVGLFIAVVAAIVGIVAGFAQATLRPSQRSFRR